MRGLCLCQLGGETVQHRHGCSLLILEGLEVPTYAAGELSNLLLDLCIKGTSRALSGLTLIALSLQVKSCVKIMAS